MQPSEVSVAVEPKWILVYAGEHTAFSVREFSNSDSLIRFVASTDLEPAEYAIIVGRVRRCDPRYKRDMLFGQLWDAGADTLADTLADGCQECAGTRILSREDTMAILNGKDPV